MDEVGNDSGRGEYAMNRASPVASLGIHVPRGLTMACAFAASISAAGFAGADPFDEYRRSCGEPAANACEALRRDDRRARCDADQILSTACTEFLGRLAGLERPTREERLVVIRGRHWAHQLRDDLTETVEAELCDERKALAENYPGYAEAWYELTRCAQDHGERVALLQTALLIDPVNASALRFLTGLVEHTGDDFGIERDRLIGYQTAGYEATEDKRMKITYAARIYETSLKSGDRDAAVAIQNRLRHDVLDTLDYGTKPENVDLACSVFDIGLGDVCAAAFESLAQAGVPLPDDMLKYIPGVLSALGHIRGTTDLVTDSDPLPITEAERDGYVARLKRAMDAQPMGFRSSEYYRVYAQFLDESEQIAALRQAVAADYGNADAKCSLGSELMRGRSYEEAWSIYAEMAAEDERGGSCDPHLELLNAGKRLGLSPR